MYMVQLYKKRADRIEDTCRELMIENFPEMADAWHSGSQMNPKQIHTDSRREDTETLLKSSQGARKD